MLEGMIVGGSVGGQRGTLGIEGTASCWRAWVFLTNVSDLDVDRRATPLITSESNGDDQQGQA